MANTIETPLAPVETGSSHVVTYTLRDIIRAVIVGLVVGALAWGLAWLFTNYVFEPLLCRDGSAKCQSSDGYAAVSAQLVAAITGLIVLVRQLVFRPLLVVLAATIALWGSLVLVAALPWYAALITTALLYGLAYGLFMLLARLRSFALTVIVMTVIVVVVRLVLTS